MQESLETKKELIAKTQNILLIYKLYDINF